MAEFTRNENAMVNIPQEFADKNFRKCLICKTDAPKWLVKEEWKLLGKWYHFKCPQCGTELKVSQDDVTGLSFTEKSFAGKMKRKNGKDGNTIYITVEKIEFSARTPENIVLEGAEITMEDYIKIAKGLM